LSDEPDGSLTMRFRAGGLLEIARHLMAWGPSVTIVAPEALQDLMRETVAALYAHIARPPADRAGRPAADRRPV
jgi:predicted DNA-binding transcriptional regulator YafY